MALTQGQIESFGLICYKQIACQYGCYMLQVRDGLSVYDQTPIEDKFYRANSMLAVIWGYDPLDSTNCLTVDAITSICWKLEEVLCFSLELSTLPETHINFPSDFLRGDFLYPDFN
jgi:hypothetical protein